MPQWMRDIPPPQVLQGLEGLIRQKEEEEGHEPSQAGLKPQGVQGQQPSLGQHPPECYHFNSVPQLSQ